ncbi:glycosyltransferase family 4 protein [Nitrosomonas sp. ANs5]|uniref:glycosyltransferase family 4 protein n=1 Tax=Nitrosomonas sp. ANs5 TaxID=3423941 RepID=UPI003D358942
MGIFQNDSRNKTPALKILHASREIRADSRYGMGRVNASLLKGLNQIGIQSDYICASDMDAASLAQAAHWRKQLARLCPADIQPVVHVLVSAWQTGRMAARRAIDQAYTHLHCHDAVVAAGASHELAGQRIAWGISEHGFSCVAQALHAYIQPLPRWLRWLLWQWERRVTRAANWIVCPTVSGRANLASELKLPIDARWHAIPHARPDLNLPEKRSARRILGWDQRSRYLLAVGQLIPLKRFELIIDAMTALPTDWRLVLLGDGDAAPYLARAERLGIAPPIITAADDVGPYLAAADAFVSASQTESFGMAILEAMTAGLPIVCTQVGGVSDVVGEAAELAAADGSDLAQRLSTVLADPAHCTTLAARSRARAEQWPDQKAVAREYHAMYLAAETNRR